MTAPTSLERSASIMGMARKLGECLDVPEPIERIEPIAINQTRLMNRHIWPDWERMERIMRGEEDGVQP